MSRLRIKKNNFGTELFNYIKNNKREYLIVTILFFIGIIIGVLFINNIEEARIDEINNYLIKLLNNIKITTNINFLNIFKKSILSNIIIAMLIWFGASTIIGIPIVYGTIILKGFSIGFTISSIINCFGVGKGIVISISLLMLHNILFIPAMFTMCVNGLKLYKSIMKNKDRKNIKFEIVRHTIFCSLMLIIMIISSVIEVYVSTNFFKFLLYYIKI